ncbi:hypothetical protein ACFCYX_02140 [Streptomyces populi]|uniref:hypothetical protein n=1 Tax=Streptomyces populi TaxID=2058924 RepID=UPI0013A70442|nr:hypothetical protein [Streptomyces populi]
MTDQEPLQDALHEAATSLIRTVGVILLIIIVPTALLMLMGIIWITFFDVAIVR